MNIFVFVVVLVVVVCCCCCFVVVVVVIIIIIIIIIIVIIDVIFIWQRIPYNFVLCGRSETMKSLFPWIIK